ncbi:MAG: substrate-binding domain-containing protein [Deltaproteobacteria bacterium]|nr:substrate-binding domain-containing protein [Deltaproteobacteria bacterium]
MLRHIFISCCLLSTLCLCGCEAQPQQQPETAKKELLIYCGTTMAAAVREVSNIFETQEDCTVKIIKEGSGVLLHSIQINQTGDLYLPGCESYLHQASSECRRSYY